MAWTTAFVLWIPALSMTMNILFIPYLSKTSAISSTKRKKWVALVPCGTPVFFGVTSLRFLEPDNRGTCCEIAIKPCFGIQSRMLRLIPRSVDTVTLAGVPFLDQATGRTIFFTNPLSSTKTQLSKKSMFRSKRYWTSCLLASKVSLELRAAVKGLERVSVNDSF